METSLNEALQRQLLDARRPTLPAVAVQLIALGRSDAADVGRLVDSQARAFCYQSFWRRSLIAGACCAAPAG